MKYKKLIISIGANIRNPSGFHPIETCEKAIKEINNYPIKIVKKSNWYISDPIPKSTQPKYYNCLINGITELNDKCVLKILNQIEDKFGRIRIKKNMSRCIDLDLIDFSNRVKKCLKLTTPHPRAHLRKFVLIPMIEINPLWNHPLYKKNSKVFLKKINNQIITIVKK